MIKEVTAYQTDDGQVFNDKKVAELHDAKIRFSHWYYNMPDNKLFGSDGRALSAETVVDWLSDNLDDISHFINQFNQ